MGRHERERGRDRDRRDDDRRKRRHEQNTDFEKFRSKLARIFFREEDVVQHGTEEYNDFWKFLRKYQQFQEMNRAKKPKMPSFPSEMSHTLGISPIYDQTLNQCFKLLPSSGKDLLNRIPLQDAEYGDVLTESMVLEFQRILALYVDFLQRERFAKLKKLRTSQANLPIAEFRQEILDKLETTQVIIVAGDTGCGKSTQARQKFEL
jgi:hypothetical protein